MNKRTRDLAACGVSDGRGRARPVLFTFLRLVIRHRGTPMLSPIDRGNPGESLFNVLPCRESRHDGQNPTS